MDNTEKMRFLLELLDALDKSGLRALSPKINMEMGYSAHENNIPEVASRRLLNTLLKMLVAELRVKLRLTTEPVGSSVKNTKLLSNEGNPLPLQVNGHAPG